MNNFNGPNIIESVYLEEDGEPYEQRRTWRERLFSRPWRPLKATRTVVPKVPSRKFVLLDSRTVVMHPAMRQELQSALSAEATRP